MFSHWSLPQRNASPRQQPFLFKKEESTDLDITKISNQCDQVFSIKLSIQSIKRGRKIPVKNSFLSAPLSMPCSPMKVTLRGFLGEERFCLCHCFKPRSTISSLVTQMLNVVEVSTLWLRVFINAEILEKPDSLPKKEGGGGEVVQQPSVSSKPMYE